MTRSAPRPVRLLANGVGLLAFALAAFPVYWMVNSSFLDRNEIRNPVPTWVPFGGDLDNFRTVFDSDQFINAMKVSLMVTGLTVVAALGFAFVAAVAVSRFRFRGRAPASRYPARGRFWHSPGAHRVPHGNIQSGARAPPLACPGSAWSLSDYASEPPGPSPATVHRASAAASG